MGRSDWKSPAAYSSLRSLDAPGFARAYLDRNAEFTRDRHRLERAAQIGALEPADLAAFTRRWGVRFRERGRAGETDGNSEDEVLWAPLALPSVVVLTAMPEDLADPAFGLPPMPLSADCSDPDRFLSHSGESFRVHLLGPNTRPQAVLLPLDRLFDHRVTAAMRLWRCLMDRRPGPNPAILSPARRDKLILGLRALDAKLENASYRDIADALFGLDDFSGPGWKTHDLRDRTIRLVRFGTGLMRGGYRKLLLHPYRRRD